MTRELCCSLTSPCPFCNPKNGNSVSQACNGENAISKHLCILWASPTWVFKPNLNGATLHEIQEQSSRMRTWRLRTVCIRRKFLPDVAINWDSDPATKKQFECNRATTPDWRRGQDGAKTLCNACALRIYYFSKVWSFPDRQYIPTKEVLLCISDQRFPWAWITDNRICEANPQNGIQGVFDQLELAAQRDGLELVNMAKGETFPHTANTELQTAILEFLMLVKVDNVLGTF